MFSVFITLLFVTLAFAQNRETVKGCIAGNVTMEFKPNLNIGGEVKTYVWNKPRGFQQDPSFAMYEPDQSPNLQTFFDEDHQVSGRIFHYPEEPATLYLTNLRKSDANKYTLIITFVERVETPTEYIVDLEVEDVCFEKPKEVDRCAVTTCYTGDNGVLKFPDGKEKTINGYTLVKVCDDVTSGNFSCCNAAGTCLYQDVCFDRAKQVGKCLVTTCFTGKYGTLKTPGNQKKAVDGYKMVKVCEDSDSGDYSCCNAAGICLERNLLQSIYLCPQLILQESRGNYLCCDAVGICQQFPLREYKGIDDFFSNGDFLSANNAGPAYSWRFQRCINIFLLLSFGALVLSFLY